MADRIVARLEPRLARVVLQGGPMDGVGIDWPPASLPSRRFILGCDKRLLVYAHEKDYALPDFDVAVFRFECTMSGEIKEGASS